MPMSGHDRYAPMMPNEKCGAPLPFDAGPKLQGAHCERMARHRGPHCWRGPAQNCTMWSDGEPVVSPRGGSLVSADDLTDEDGTIWR